MISRVQLVCLTVLALTDVALGMLSAWMLPSQVPVHWNFRGQADRYGSPWELALVLPGFVIGTVGLFLLLPRLGEVGAQLRRSGTTYGRMAIAVVVALIGIHLLVIVRGSYPFDVVSAILANLGVLIAVLGNWTSKLRRNAFAGIRTPWTLQSDIVWERTNRVGGRLMFAFGLIVAVAAFCLPVWAALTLLLGGLLVLVVWSLLYSRSLSRELR